MFGCNAECTQKGMICLMSQNSSERKDLLSAACLAFKTVSHCYLSQVLARKTTKLSYLYRLGQKNKLQLKNETPYVKFTWLFTHRTLLFILQIHMGVNSYSLHEAIVLHIFMNCLDMYPI